MIRRIVTQKMLELNAYEKWNQFIHLIAMEDYIDLTRVQRIAHLCFWYDSEVQNGGHLQFFLNRDPDLLDETKQALIELGAVKQASVLSNAMNIALTNGIPKVETIQEYVDEALVGMFDEVDTEYHHCKPDITKLLELFLEYHEDEFLTVE